jgi:uncharacterized circularly permuted ATP-grasp superfamily protein
MGAYHAGNVTLANAVGAGAADGKAMYAYMPDVISFIWAKPAPAECSDFRCRETERYVLDHLDELVVRSEHSGGYGMLVGPHARGRKSRVSRKQAPRRLSLLSQRWRSRHARSPWRPASPRR